MKPSGTVGLISCRMRRCRPSPASWMLLVLIVTGPWTPPCRGVTPSSPEVRAVIDQAVSFLATAEDDRVGALALAGLVFVKEREPNHPKVKQAVKACVEFAERPQAELARDQKYYDLPVALIFLCELDANAYQSQIEHLLAAMRQRQLPEGGWGYSYSAVGDTSMTQYCVLAAWTADRAGIEVPPEMMERVCRWLLRTQDIGGGWGYQGIDPGEDAPRREQFNVRLSLCAAGAGSVYICADLFGISTPRRRESASGLPDVPDAFRPVVSRDDVTMRQVARPQLMNRVRNALKEADDYLEARFEIAPPQYPYYYLYALERYHSFRATALGRVDAEPDWYNQGFERLAATQQPDGSWSPANPEVNVVPSTAFATLFLLRSSLKSIQTFGGYGEGLLVGGRGLPAQLNELRLQDGRLVNRRQARTLAEIVAVLEDPETSQLQELSAEQNAGRLVPEGPLQPEDAERLGRLIRGGEYQVRRLAVEALASRRDFADIPVLIYALSDPDDRVSLAARDGLRFVTRRLGGFGMPDDPTEADKQAAVQAWTAWYRGIDPSSTPRDGG